MSGYSDKLVDMAKTKEYPGFPRFYKKGEQVLRAGTPKEAVNLEHRGFKVLEDTPKVEAPKTLTPAAVETPKPQGNTRPLAH